jgi:hypothetical protein
LLHTKPEEKVADTVADHDKRHKYSVFQLGVARCEVCFNVHHSVDARNKYINSENLMRLSRLQDAITLGKIPGWALMRNSGHAVLIPRME